MARLLVVPVAAALVFLAEVALSYSGVYRAPSGAPLPFDRVALPVYPAATQEPPESRPQGRSFILVDTAHDNRYNPEELKALSSHLSARGAMIEFLGSQDPRDWSNRPGQREREAALQERLRQADGLLVAVPGSPFTRAEVEAVQKFVGKGGKLLMVGDPGRDHALNSLATAFGITFATDYLYNVVEHEGNFRNVFFTPFQTDAVTKDLRRVVFYVAGSVAAPAGTKLVATDASTLSSTQERWQLLSPMVRDLTGRVVAANDITFLAEPYSAVADNDRLIANLAEFLTPGQRSFDLEDFPHLFRRDLDVLVSNTALLEQASLLKARLETPSRRVRVVRTEDSQRDTVVLTLFRDAAQVSHYLSPAEVLVGAQVWTPHATALQRPETGLLLLDQRGGRSVVVLVAEEPEGVQQVLDQVKEGTFRQRLVSSRLGIYQVDKR